MGTTFKRPEWAKGALYNFLMGILPEHCTEYQILDVPRLSEDMKRSRQAVYTWFQKGKLSPDNAKKICALANTEDNVAALEKLGRTPPVMRDFDAFVYA